MPPRAAVLRWPNGQTSCGRLAVGPLASLNFMATEIEGPLAQRCQKADRIVQAPLDPRPIQVAVVSEGDAEDLLYVEPTLLDTVPQIHPSMLKELAETAGGEDEGVNTKEQTTLSSVILGVLNHLEANCTDPTAMRQARNALERPFIEIKLTRVEEAGRDSHDYRCQILNGDGDDDAMGDLGKMLERLEEGEHLYLRATHSIHPECHSLAISATRLAGEQVQVSLFNSNGWGRIARSNTHDRFPAIGKTVSLDKARAALNSLAGGVIELPAPMRGRVSPIWHDLVAGAPLSAWLRAVNPELKMQPTGKHMTPQKDSDCAIEVEFAWLASVLSEADYKLAKAHVLNILTQAAVHNELHERVVKRLRDRVTSSLSAHAMTRVGQAIGTSRSQGPERSRYERLSPRSHTAE